MAPSAQQSLSALGKRSRTAPVAYPLLFLAALAGGCMSTPQPAPGQPVRTQARSPFLGLFSRTDPHALRLDVRALPCGNAINSNCVLIATVVDERGKPLRGKRVEWTLEGAGQILAADDRSGPFSGHGKLESHYAVTETGNSPQRVPRGTGRPEDDIVLDTGETWCMISSATEGDSHLTVFSPEVANMDMNRVNVTQHWYDTACTLPPARGGRPGDRIPLDTRVYRQGDNQPLAGYWVRYRYLDGPPVLLAPTGSTEALVVSDTSGLARATVYQSSPQGGRTRLSVQVLRPDARGGNVPPVVVSAGETFITWQAPAVALTHTGPITLAVGQEGTFSIVVRNSAPTATPAYTVRAALPDNADFVRSDPSAIHDGNNLIWTLGELRGGATRELRFTVKSRAVGSLTSRATVVTAEGLRDEQAVTATVVPPAAARLDATLTAPAAAVVMAGANAVVTPVTCQVAVRNPGTGPATNVVMALAFKAGVLEHESKKDPVEIAVGTLQPGETRLLTLGLTPRQAGDTPLGVTVRADGGLSAKADRTLKVLETGVTLKMAGPSLRSVGRPTEWSLEVRNTGQTTLQQVMVRDVLPPELQFVEAPRVAEVGEGRLTAIGVVWDIGILRPSEVRMLRLVANGTRPGVKVVNTASLTAQAIGDSPKPGDPLSAPLGTLQARADAPLTIQGVAALALKVSDSIDPVHIGEQTAYLIQVRNQGSLDDQRVQVAGKVPPEMRVVGVWGPGGYRRIGDRLEFSPVDRLPPGAVLNYAINVVPSKAGDIRFHVELTSSTLKEPLVKEESTMVR